jgi:hypothetical protein
VQKGRPRWNHVYPTVATGARLSRARPQPSRSEWAAIRRACRSGKSSGYPRSLRRTSTARRVWILSALQSATAPPA